MILGHRHAQDTAIGWVALAAVFFAASRDTLRKYHTRVAELLSAEKGHDHGKPRESA